MVRPYSAQVGAMMFPTSLLCILMPLAKFAISAAPASLCKSCIYIFIHARPVSQKPCIMTSSEKASFVKSKEMTFALKTRDVCHTRSSVSSEP